jgi:hypothetical protein
MPPLSLQKALAICPAAVSSSIAPRHVSLTFRRHKSGPYGYEQAKALGIIPTPGSERNLLTKILMPTVYSKYGEPSDVLL